MNCKNCKYHDGKMCTNEEPCTLFSKFEDKYIGIKHDKEKIRFDLVPWECINEVAKVYSWGSAKYGDHNWKSVTPKSRYVAAMMRHFCEWQAGHTRDPETGLYHLAHMVWNGIALLWFEMRGEK